MSRKISLVLGMIMCLAGSGLASAQGMGGRHSMGRDMGGPPPMVGAFHDRHFGRWWNDPKLAQELNITAEQKQKMDSIFQQHRLNLIDLHANLEKQEVLLGPMLSGDNPNETQALAQIDQIAQARANLEKANARMLFDIRKTLTADQWKKLKTLHRERMAQEMRRGHENWRHYRGGGPGRPGPGAPPPPQGGQTPAPPQ